MQSASFGDHSAAPDRWSSPGSEAKTRGGSGLEPAGDDPAAVVDAELGPQRQLVVAEPEEAHLPDAVDAIKVRVDPRRLRRRLDEGRELRIGQRNVDRGPGRRRPDRTTSDNVRRDLCLDRDRLNRVRIDDALDADER